MMKATQSVRKIGSVQQISKPQNGWFLFLRMNKNRNYENLYRKASVWCIEFGCTLYAFMWLFLDMVDLTDNSFRLYCAQIGRMRASSFIRPLANQPSKHPAQTRSTLKCVHSLYMFEQRSISAIGEVVMYSWIFEHNTVLWIESIAFHAYAFNKYLGHSGLDYICSNALFVFGLFLFFLIS